MCGSIDAKVLRIFFRSLLVALVLAMPWVSAAAPITYDESLDGDLDYAAFVFDVGLNSISATNASTDGFVDLDVFHFYVPRGTLVTGVTFSGGTNDTGILSSLYASVGLVDPRAHASSTIFVDLIPNPTQLPVFGSVLPLNPSGSKPYGVVFPFGGARGLELFYRLDLLVEASPNPIPEPSLFLLLGPGLWAVRLRFRRRFSDL